LQIIIILVQPESLILSLIIKSLILLKENKLKSVCANKF